MEGSVVLFESGLSKNKIYQYRHHSVFAHQVLLWLYGEPYNKLSIKKRTLEWKPDKTRRNEYVGCTWGSKRMNRNFQLRRLPLNFFIWNVWLCVCVQIHDTDEMKVTMKTWYRLRSRLLHADDVCWGHCGHDAPVLASCAVRKWWTEASYGCPNPSWHLQMLVNAQSRPIDRPRLWFVSGTGALVGSVGGWHVDVCCNQMLGLPLHLAWSSTIQVSSLRFPSWECFCKLGLSSPIVQYIAFYSEMRSLNIAAGWEKSFLFWPLNPRL